MTLLEDFAHRHFKCTNDQTEKYREPFYYIYYLVDDMMILLILKITRVVLMLNLVILMMMMMMMIMMMMMMASGNYMTGVLKELDASWNVVWGVNSNDEIWMRSGITSEK